MITYKLKYNASDEDKSLILNYQRQYSSCLHWMYNRVCEERLSNGEIERQCKQLNNIGLINSWFVKCSLWEAKSLKSKGNNMVFGGKKLFFNRMNGLISKEEHKLKKLTPFIWYPATEVQVQYSSFIGNFVFRELELTDPVLSSIEIGRRGYEFVNQYITKTKEIKKNIIWLDTELFKRQIAKSLEEFGLKFDSLDLYQIYSYFKNSKIKYRVPVTSDEESVYQFRHNKSYISHMNYKVHLC